MSEPRAARSDRIDRQAAAQAARDALTSALLTLAEHGDTTPCHDDERFISSDSGTLRSVAHYCDRCPIRRQCAAAGEFEHAGLWAGVIRDQHAGKPGRRARRDSNDDTEVAS